MDTGILSGVEKAIRLLKEIGDAQNQTEGIEAIFNRRIRALTNGARKKVKPFEEEINRKFSQLAVFMEGRRAELTDDGKKKTVRLPTGEVGWRISALALEVIDQEEAVAVLKEMGLRKAVRQVEEVDKNELKKLLKKDPELLDKVTAISAKQDEFFWAKPINVSVKLERDKEGQLKKTKPKKKKE